MTELVDRPDSPALPTADALPGTPAGATVGTAADVLAVAREQGASDGMLGGINAVIVGNYLTTLGRPATADLDMLSDLKMPIKALGATL